MARSATTKASALIDGLVYTVGAFVALLIFLGLYSFLSPVDPVPNRLSSIPLPFSSSSPSSADHDHDHDHVHDPPDETFYDDPKLSYTIDKPVTNWDEKRAAWVKLHPGFSHEKESVLMVSGSQPGPCPSYEGDHLLLRSFKNKADYCRLHNIQLFYNTALLNPAMPTFWAKIPLLRAAMLAHPEAEWVWWVDSDAVFTDMDFFPPLARYRAHNMVVHGWPDMVYEKKSWVGLNAGVFLIRNCQWSLDFMDEWASMGPASPDYDRWGRILTAAFKDKVFNNSDDQSALVYLILTGKGGWRDKIYLENEYYFEGYWVEIVGRLDDVAEQYDEVERHGPAGIRRRHAERVHMSYAERRDAVLGLGRAKEKGGRRPFVTHFTGCQPCNGERNKLYSGNNCTEGMYRALNFADDQVLRVYGFHHAGLLSGDVRPLPFDYPRAAR